MGENDAGRTVGGKKGGNKTEDKGVFLSLQNCIMENSKKKILKTKRKNPIMVLQPLQQRIVYPPMSVMLKCSVIDI